FFFGCTRNQRHILSRARANALYWPLWNEVAIDSRLEHKLPQLSGILAVACVGQKGDLAAYKLATRKFADAREITRCCAELFQQRARDPDGAFAVMADMCAA